MKYKIRVIAVFMTITFLLGSFPCDVNAAAAKKVTVDYNKQTMTIVVSKIKEAYMIPLNDIVTSWGGSTKLDSSKRFINATVEKLTLQVTNGSKIIKIKDVNFTMEAAAVLQGTTMYVTIDVFSKALGIKATLNTAKTSVVLDFSKSENAAVVNVVIPLVKPKFIINFTFVGFYNAGADVPDPRNNPAIQYAFNFNKSTAMKICYFTKITYNGLGTTVNAPITKKVFKKDGSLFHESTSTVQLKKGAASLYYRWGIGWNEPGHWPVDNYTVEVYLWDKLVDKEQFNIFSLLPDRKDPGQTNPDQMSGSVWTQKDGNGVKGQFAFLLKNGYFYVGYKGDAASIYNDDAGMRSGPNNGGVKYKLTSDKLTLYKSDGKIAQEIRRKGNSIFIGTGVIHNEVTKGSNGAPDLTSISMDGEYCLTSK